MVLDWFYFFFSILSKCSIQSSHQEPLLKKHKHENDYASIEIDPTLCRNDFCIKPYLFFRSLAFQEAPSHIGNDIIGALKPIVIGVCYMYIAENICLQGMRLNILSFTRSITDFI